MIVLFLSSLVVCTFFASERRSDVVALTIQPHVYVDSPVWHRHIESNKSVFLPCSISLKDKPSIANILNQALKREIEPPYGLLLNQCVQWEKPDFFEKSTTQKPVPDEKITNFVSLLCAIELYKFVNVIQLHIGELIQIGYEQSAPSAFFRELKEEILGNHCNEIFYQEILRKAEQALSSKAIAVKVIQATKRFDVKMVNTVYDAVYLETMGDLFSAYLQSLNEFVNPLLNSKAKL